MKSLYALLAALAVLPALAVSTVTVTSVEQDPASGAIKVNYGLTGDPAVITFGAVVDGKELTDSQTRRVGGDVNRLVQPGTGKSLVWCPHDNDGTTFDCTSSFVARLKAWPTNSPPDYLVIDLDGCKLDTANFNYQYYTSTNAFPYPVTDRRYKTDFLVMRRIPAAGVTWRMGSETAEAGRATNGSEQPHYVKLTEDFYMAIYEVTYRQYIFLKGSALDKTANTIFARQTTYQEGDDYPAVGQSSKNLRGTSWPINEHAGVGGDLATFRRRAGLRLDLATDAQWEFACRAGSKDARYDGEELDDIAWYLGNSTNETTLGKIAFLHPVGQKRPNAFGIYDMLGNASEVVLDWYGVPQLPEGESFATYVFENPIGASEGVNEQRVARGGAFSSVKNDCRCARRVGWNQTYGDGAFYSNPPGTDSEVLPVHKCCGGIRLVCPAAAVH